MPQSEAGFQSTFRLPPQSTEVLCACCGRVAYVAGRMWRRECRRCEIAMCKQCIERHQGLCTDCCLELYGEELET